jgi:hypothetical protein
MSYEQGRIVIAILIFIAAAFVVFGFILFKSLEDIKKKMK